MRKSYVAWSIIFFTLPMAALTAAPCFASQMTLAQSHSGSSPHPITQPVQADDRNTASVNTFSGRIVKSGNKLVLAASDNLTTYQLDDQQKAREFLNRSVRVTGSLDASTGTIRIRAIDPA